MSFSLMSWEFLGLSLAAVVSMAVLRGVARQAAFLAVNIIFVWGLVLGTQGALSTLAFCLLGYALTRVILWRPRWGFPLSLAVYVALFVYMRNYDFLRWILPAGALMQVLATVGLSFLFFKVVHVMIEARSGTLGHFDLVSYLNYCLNFTTFIMGPIQRYQDFRAQASGEEQAIPLRPEAHFDATVRVLQGLVKAYVIAAWVGQFALAEHAQVLGMPWRMLLVQLYAFYFYLYFNFSGYCDVVIGVGSLMGIRPPENFDKPFLARDIAEFWLRFHRSLTQWLTSYVFAPVYKWALTNEWLGARPLLATSAALLMTMVVSGLWHGTTVSFLLFGLTHGVYFVIFRSWETVLTRLVGKQGVRRWRSHWAVQGAGAVITFNAVAFSFLFFRVDSVRAMQLVAAVWGRL